MRRKGFTLVELLAVIVILGIILAIAIPGISGLIESARKNAFEDSVKLIIKSITTKQSIDGNYNVTNLSRSNMETDLGVSNENYESISATIIDSNAYIDVVGQGKWAGLEAHGTLANLSIITGTTTVDELADESCYDFDSATNTITDYDYENSSCPLNLLIPPTIGGVAVEYIGELAFSDEFPEMQCYEEGVGYVSVDPSYVHTEGDGYSFCYSFSDYFGELTSVTIPSSVIGIDDSAFVQNQLSKVTFDPSSSLEYIGNEAFSGNYLTSITIPTGVVNVFDWAFGENSLINVSIPSTVTSIGSGAFDSNQLTSVIIPNSVTSLGDWVFSYNQISNLTIGTGISYIGEGVFENNLLTSLTIPNNITTIGQDSFRYNRLTSLTIPSSVTDIYLQAFNNNSLPDNQAFIYKRNPDGSIDNTTLIGYGGLKKNGVVIPNNVNTIDVQSFGQSELVSVTIPNSVTRIEANAFRSNHLATLTIPDSITTITQSSFQDNWLTSLNLPNTITKIEHYAFMNNKLTSLTIPSSVDNIGVEAFRTNQLTSLTLPNKAITINNAAFSDNQLPDATAFIYARNGDGSINNTMLIGYGGANISNVVIPNNVTTIGQFAFAYNNITNLTIPTSVVSADYWAFGDNLLTNIIIPTSLTSLPESAFINNKFETVNIPHHVTYIGPDAYKSNPVKSVIIDNSPGSVTIENNFFGEGPFEGGISPTYLR